MRKLTLVALLLSSTAAFAGPVDNFSAQVNSNITSNGQGAITGAKLNSVLLGVVPIFSSMGTWDVNGVYTLNPGAVPLPSTSSVGGVLAASAPTHQFQTGISTAGVPLFAQPLAGDVGGLAASATSDTTNAANIITGTLSGARLPAPTASVLGGVQAASAALHQFQTGISTAGLPTFAQPQVADVSNAAAHVATAAALVSWTNYSSPVSRDDVPGILYSDTGASCTAADGGAQIQPVTGHCWQANLSRGAPLLLWTNGVIPADMAPPLTKANAALSAVSGGDVTLSPGTWPIGSGVFLSPNVTLRGATFGGGTIIKPTFAAGDVISIGTGFNATLKHFAGVTDVSFAYGSGTTFRTSGAMIEFNGARNVAAKNITCHTGTYSCVSIDSSGFDSTLDNIQVDGENHSGIQLGCSPNNTVGIASNVSISNSDLFFSHAASIEMCATSGIHITTTNTDGSLHGIWAHPGPNQYVNATDIDHSYFDFSNQESVLLDTSAGSGATITEFVMGSETWIASSGNAYPGYTPQNGAVVTSTRSPCMSLSGPANTIIHSSFDVTVFNCQGDGIDMNAAGAYDKFTGQIAQTGNGGNLGYQYGMRVTGGASNWSWDGMNGGETSISPNGTANNSQQYGVVVDGGSDYFSIRGIMNGNLIGPVSDSSTGFHKSFEGMVPAQPCIGYAASASSTTGTLGPNTTVACYINQGNRIFVSASIAITSAGSSPGGSILVNLPRAEGSPYTMPVQLSAAETSATGFLGRATIANGAAVVAISKYDNSYLGCNGCVISVSGTYPVTSP